MAELHAEIERLIAAAGLESTIIRPGMLASNALLWWASAIRAGGVLGHRIKFEELSPEEFRSQTEGSCPRPVVDYGRPGPIELTFATVRHRTKVTQGPGSTAAGIAMAVKLIEAPQRPVRQTARQFPDFRKSMDARRISDSASPRPGRLPSGPDKDRKLLLTVSLI